MRLQQLDLIKYGKFTSRTLTFARNERDFHLIVGANEAGKSTLRRAISELLFGMRHRSEMDFLHPLAELRLGAVIESGVGSLAFQRCRGRKPLRRPDDSQLPDSALIEHLGSTSQGLFERMFCLDLDGLLAGGKTILDASDDVGQLLFQSAAGIASLGAVRDALAEEANKLYAPRRSGERAFYQALDRLETAKQSLRGATVNTRHWTAAVGKVESIEAAIREASAQYNALATERQQLERLRRIGPRVAQWREAQAELQQLADAVAFPTDAAQRLAQGEVALATQATTLELHRDMVKSLQAQIDALTRDPAILAVAAKVEALATQRQAVGNHPRDIGRRGEEVQTQMRQAATLSAQLGWPGDEAELRTQLPSTLALKTLKAQMQTRGAWVQARQSAQDNHQRAQDALERLQARQTTQPLPTLPVELNGALQDAQACKLGQGRQRGLQAATQQARNQLDRALTALAPWRMPPHELAALVLPTEERLAALKSERANLAARLDTAQQQHAQAQEQARLSALALQQFAAGRSLVTLDEVREARHRRDALWGGIKSHEAPLDATAGRLDEAIGHADQLVDSQRDSATDSAKLLSLRQDSERDTASVQARAQASAQAQQALKDVDALWAVTALQAGMPGMPLTDLSAWLVHRKTALDAAATAEAKALELATDCETTEAATTALCAALQGSGIDLPANVSLSDLCAIAEQRINERQTAKAAADMLAQQIAEAWTELAHQAHVLQNQTAELEQWQTQWLVALQQARLDTAVTSFEAASGAIELAEQVRSTLAEMDDKRVNRIQAMERDLSNFGADAAALLDALGTGDTCSDPFETAQQLSSRLQQAREIEKDHGRLQSEHRSSAAAVRNADAALAATKAALQSMYALASSDDHRIVGSLIAASDRRRACDGDMRQHRQAIVDGGDGLPFEALLTEYDTVPPETVKPRLDELDHRLTESVDLKTRLVSDLAQAKADLQRVQGGADAAVAESMRLESLAQMGDAAERYMKVSAAARLLRWAIDRYRERKQGPLLQRAGELFAQLTLGGFDRLVPDFEVTPPKLIAVRGTGERVPIEGLSEGTRDQLFLALRLAALEMHIASDSPLPFIADDLFVNFHDSRSRAGLAALGELSRTTQVIFLTHHEHLVEVARECVGRELNVVSLET